MKKKYKYIYGPVSSWRLGSSLGVDPVYAGKGKICSFDCMYCQAGKTAALTNKRKIFIPTDKILDEIKALPALEIDYITFSGAGEPTLAKNLREIIKGIRKIRNKKIAVLTNSSLMDRKDVRADLALADFVIAKLDVHSQALFRAVNRPAKSVKLANIVKGLKRFTKEFKGKFALQIMFMGRNKKHAAEIAKLTEEINADEIHLNTALRPCGVRPLSRKEMDKVKIFFKGLNCISIYDVKKKKVKPMDKSAMLERRGEA